MINQAQRRSYLLVITSISVNLAMIYTLLVPQAGNYAVAEFEFPKSWNSNTTGESDTVFKSSKINLDQPKTEVIKARQRYQYIQDGREIQLEMSYLVGTRGDVEVYLQNYTNVEAETIKAKQVRQLKDVGYHALFTSSDRAYLTSCISPRSPSNVTYKQFSQYRYQNDLQWRVGWDWLRGKASIRDRRCLWVLMSIPVTQGNIQDDYQALEVAWKDIYLWWLTNFPSLTK